jgi:hypothetical protein
MLIGMFTCCDNLPIIIVDPPARIVRFRPIRSPNAKQNKEPTAQPIWNL